MLRIEFSKYCPPSLYKVVFNFLVIVTVLLFFLASTALSEEKKVVFHNKVTGVIKLGKKKKGKHDVIIYQLYNPATEKSEEFDLGNVWEVLDYNHRDYCSDEDAGPDVPKDFDFGISKIEVDRGASK